MEGDAGGFGTRLAALFRRQIGIIAGLLFLCVVGLFTGFTPTPMNNYVLLADAWIHGRAWVVPGGPYIDTVPYLGHAYVVQAPFPAILMLPFVALGGIAANQTLVCAVVAAVGVAATYQVGWRVRKSVADAIALTAFAAFGTSYFVCAANGDVWLFAHICAFTFSMLAVGELLGKRRGWLVGLFACAAGFSRYPLLPIVALDVIWLVAAGSRRAALSCALVVLAATIPWIVYNEARWGTWYDSGFTIWYHVMDPRSHGGLPPFSFASIAMQLKAYFVKPLHNLGRFPWLAPPMFGFAITWLSFSLLGILLTIPRTVRSLPVTMLWISTVIAAVPGFLYYDTGGVQFGMRHALDFEPFAVALLAFALATRYRILLRCALYASATFGAYESLVFLLDHADIV